MVDKIKLLAIDPEQKKWYEQHLAYVKKTLPDRRVWSVGVSIVVNSELWWNNAHIYTSEDVNKELTYSEARARALDLIDALGTRADSTRCPHRIKLDGMWEELHKSHISQDGDRIPKGMKPFDIDVTVLVNGKLWYHGWSLIGVDSDMIHEDTVKLIARSVVSNMKQDNSTARNVVDVKIRTNK